MTNLSSCCQAETIRFGCCKKDTCIKCGNPCNPVTSGYVSVEDGSKKNKQGVLTSTGGETVIMCLCLQPCKKDHRKEVDEAWARADERKKIIEEAKLILRDLMTDQYSENFDIRTLEVAIDRISNLK